MQTWILHSKKFWAANGQQTDSKRTSDVRTVNGRLMFGQQTDINLPTQRLCTKTSDNRLLSVCCPRYRTNVWLFSCDTCSCLHSPKVLFSWLSLNFLFLFVPIYRSTVCAHTDSKLTSKLFINRLCTNGRLTICAQILQCTNSTQEHSSSDISDNKRTANGRPKYPSTVWHL